MKMWQVVCVVVIALVSGISGFSVGVSRSSKKATSDIQCVKSYPLLNPYFSCEKQPVLRKTSLNTFRNKLLSRISEHIAANDASHVSVYLYDLVNGPTLGIEQNAEFQPASLLKLPILMAYYKLSEEKPDVLTQSFGYTGSLDTGGQTIEEGHTIKPDTMYTTEDLLHRMISYSDNRSKELLRVKLPQFAGKKDYLLQTYVDLGLLELDNTDDETITVKMYSSLFRLLFNASFLSSELSNKALDLLSQSEYTSGLVAGVPKGIKVAHKFGEGGSGSTVQLHDCGVIYFPNNPYSLCVMTRGTSYQKLEHIIADVSRMVYEEMQSRKQ
jgi:beta-lactamase class A